MGKQTKARANWILVIVGLLLVIYGVLCYTTFIPNGFHKDFGFVFFGLGVAAISWGLYVSRTSKKVILTEKIKVTEEPGAIRKAIGATIYASLFVVFFVGTMLVLGPNPETTWIGGQPYVFGGTMPMGVALALILGGSIAGAMLIGMSVLFIGRRKVLVTPLLVVAEKNPTIYDGTAGQMILVYNFGVVFGGIIKSLAGRSNFILSEEGIIFYRASGLTLARWRKFKFYKSNRETGEFKLSRGTGEVNLTSQQQFDEVNKILSEHIRTSSTNPQYPPPPPP